MDKIEKIKKHKIKEVAERKNLVSLDELKARVLYERSVFSMAEFVKNKDRTGVIAEVKKKSPSEGFINRDADVEKITSGYIAAGASGLSVLTDEAFRSEEHTSELQARGHVVFRLLLVKQK